MADNARTSLALVGAAVVAMLLLAWVPSMPAEPRQVFAQTTTADVVDLPAPATEDDPRPGCREVNAATICGLPYEPGAWCGQDGNRIHAIYLRRADQQDGYHQMFEKIEREMWGADEILNLSAQREGRTAHFRFMTNDPCKLQVDHVTTTMPLNGGEDALAAVQAAGYEGKHDRTWAIFYDEPVECGWATFYSDSQPDPALNMNNQREHYVAYSSQCVNRYVVAHELAHTMGAVLPDAPHRYSGSHCSDGRDVLCVKTSKRPACRDLVFDCGRDDYFAFNPQSDWLRTHWNTVNSSWIMVS